MAKRNSDLLEQRNKKVYERYKELYDIDCMRHLKVLERLSSEFYIGTQAIQKIVLSQKRVTKESNLKTA